MRINFKKTYSSVFYHKSFIFIVLLIGLILRLGFVFYTGGEISQGDEGLYIDQAKYLYTSGITSFSTMPDARTPGTGFLILFPFILFGMNLLKAKAFFGLVGTLTIYLVYKYTSDIFDEKSAIFAALITAFYPFFIYWSGHLMTETPSVFFIVSALFFTNRFISTDSKKAPLYGALAGLSWTMLIITRAQNFYFLPLLFGFLLFKKTYKTKLLALLLFFTITISIPLIWMIRNHNHYGLFAIDTHGGVTLLINTAFYDESRISWKLGTKALENSKIVEKAKNMNAGEKEYYYREKTLEYIKQNPLLFIKTRFDNFIQFWRFYPRTNIQEQDASPFLKSKKIYFVFISLLTEPWLILAGLFGLLIAIKKRLSFALLPGLFILFTTAIHTIVYSQMRYRLTLMPIIIIFAIYGISRIASKGKQVNEKN